MKQTVHKIFGPPGTGKTTRLISIVRESMQAGIPLTQIAYLAHTKAAANEAYDRVRDFAGSKRPDYFCTIHAAARRSTGVSPRNIWGGMEWNLLARSTGMRFNVGAEHDDSDTSIVVGDPVIQCINFAKARMISVEEAAQQFERYDVVSPANISMIQMAMESIKKANDKFDFDDILALYMSGPQPLPVRLVLVDEAQDLSTFQWRVVREMWKSAQRIVLCGDDDQSIYGFLGADPDGFLKHPCDTSEVLPVSYRVPRKIGAIAEKIIKPVKGRQQKQLVWRSEDGVVKSTFADKSTLPIKAGESTMVLVRHNIQGRSVYKAIREAGIPCAYNDESYLTDKEARALIVYHKLRAGESVSWNEAISMLEQMPGRGQSIERMKRLRTEDRTRRLVAGDFDINFIPNPVNQFGTTLQSQRVVALCCWNVDRFGVEILGKPPKVNVMTIHAAKGREADHVIVLTDCYGSVWDSQDGPEHDTERKVAYVAVTRARHRLTVIAPSTEMYLKALVEAV